MNDYLHAIWSAKQGVKVSKNLASVEAKLKIPDDLKDFIRDVKSYCTNYLAVVKPSSQTLLTEDLRDLRRLNVRQADGFLTMVHKHANDRLEEAVGLVLSLQVRNISTGRHQANEYEQQWPKWAGAIRHGDIEEAFRQIRAAMISDEEFKGLFKTLKTSSPGAARHMLRRLDPIVHSNSGAQPSDVDVEHILPKSVVSQLTKNKDLKSKVEQWIMDLGFEVPTTRRNKERLGNRLLPSLNSLGNQALLNFKMNRALKDSPFIAKRHLYETQAHGYTSSLVDYDEWTLDQIRLRQMAMAERAPQIWPK